MVTADEFDDIDDSEGIASPTDEQMRHGTFELDDIVDRAAGKSLVIGKAYRRLPWFETMYRRDLIDSVDRRCLRFYRRAYESSDRSLVRSVLNRDFGSGDGEGPSEWRLRAKDNLEMCETAIGSVVDTLQSVALQDKPFLQTAIERFGSREQHFIINGRHKTRIVAKRKADIRIIEDEFFLGLRRLVEVATPYTFLDREK
jgi:hypothetical protein